MNGSQPPKPHDNSLRLTEMRSVPRKAIAKTPVLMAASELEMMSLTQTPRSLPLKSPTLSVPGLPMLGRDCQMECPSVPRAKTQHRTSGSWIPKSAKKLKLKVAATARPAIAARRVVASGRTEAVRLLAAANQITKVAGRRTMVTPAKDEKLTRNESMPNAARRPPRTPGLLSLDAMMVSKYGEAYTKARTVLPASCSTYSGSSASRKRREPRTIAGTSPNTAPTTAVLLPRPTALPESPSGLAIPINPLSPLSGGGNRGPTGGRTCLRDRGGRRN